MHACSLVGTVRELGSHVETAERSTHVTATRKTDARLTAAEIAIADLFALLEPVSTPLVGDGPPPRITDALASLLDEIRAYGQPRSERVPDDDLSLLRDDGYVEVVRGHVLVPVGESGPAAHTTLVVLSMLADRLSDIATSCYKLTRLAGADPQPRAPAVADSWRALGDAVADLATYCEQLHEAATELGDHTTTVAHAAGAATPNGAKQP